MISYDEKKTIITTANSNSKLCITIVYNVCVKSRVGGQTEI